MNFLKAVKNVLVYGTTNPDVELVQKLANNQGQYIVKPNGSIALNLKNDTTQKKLRKEISKYKNFSVSTKG